LNNQLSANFDICIATDWEYDDDFLKLVEKNVKEYGLTTYTVYKYNLKDTVSKIQTGKLNFRFLFDRASDTEPTFVELQNLFLQKNIPVFESLEQMLWASDKATMHLEFIENGINTPFTIILPSFKNVEKMNLNIHDLAVLGRPFIIKPANTTGGGIGVVDGAETLEDVLSARLTHKNDKYLIQKKIIPVEKSNKRFWFRGYYACGLVQFSWWNDLTHLSEILTAEQIDYFELEEMFRIVDKIAAISKLNFFSTEIALTDLNEFIVVDYINESCDMRLKSKHYDGVPNLIVENTAKKIADFVHNKIKNKNI